jgi:hypothetical protein
MRSEIVKVLLLLPVLCASIALGQQQETRESCDCTHWPWAKECNRVCAVTAGTVVSSRKDRLTISEGTKQRTFKLTPKTQVVGSAKNGTKVKVLYRRGVAENLATGVVVTADPGTANTQHGQIIQGPGSAVSINQQGGNTIGTIIVHEPPLPHVEWAQQSLAPGEPLGALVGPRTTIGRDSEFSKQVEELRRNPGALITAYLDASLTGGEFIAECVHDCRTVEAFVSKSASQFGSRGQNNVATVLFLSPATIPAGLEIKWEIRSLSDEPVTVKKVTVRKAR